MLRESVRIMKREEQEEFLAEMATWLDAYTDKVIAHVMRHHIDEIIGTPSTRKLLKELHERSQKQFDHFKSNLSYMIEYVEDVERTSTPHLDCLSHAQSYRDVLYDLYIADMHD